MTAFEWVKDVRVNYAAKEATVTVDPLNYRAEALVESLTRAGFEDSSVRTP